MRKDNMKTIRIMPCLDMRNGRVVKGINFVHIKDAGDPVEHASFYEQEGADELAVLDISATLENRNTRLEWVQKVSSVITIPLTVGGGISSLEDIERVMDAGADRVLMNSSAVKNPRLIREASDSYGSKTVTIALDGKRNPEMDSGFELIVSGGTKPTGKDAIAWAGECQDLGAGVLLPTSMDGDGTRKGYDNEFIRAISEKVTIPVVASGGAGELDHFYQGVVQGGAEILLAASVFHYRIFSIRQVKEYLLKKGLKVNL
jgi:cyclase